MIQTKLTCKKCQKVVSIAEDAVCPSCKENICIICGRTDTCTDRPAHWYWSRPGICSTCAVGIGRLMHSMLDRVSAGTHASPLTTHDTLPRAA